MYKSTLVKMLKNLNKLESNEIIDEVKEELEGLIKYQSNKAFLVWDFNDIAKRANEITNERNKFDSSKFKDVLYAIENNHDATTGVDWGVIDVYLTKYAKID